jgi:hypothetical protein
MRVKRVLWHLFGAVGAFVFAVGSASLVAGNTEIIISRWLWAIVTAVGFAGVARYAQWYRSG